MTVKPLDPEYLSTTSALDITFSQYLERLQAANIELSDVPEVVANDIVYKGQLIMDGYFIHKLLTKAEARQLLTDLTNIPNRTIAGMVEQLDKQPDADVSTTHD